MRVGLSLEAVSQFVELYIICCAGAVSSVWASSCCCLQDKHAGRMASFSAGTVLPPGSHCVWQTAHWFVSDFLSCGIRCLSAWSDSVVTHALNNTVITYSRFSTSLDIDVDGHRASWSLMFQLLYRDHYIETSTLCLQSFSFRHKMGWYVWYVFIHFHFLELTVFQI